MLVWTLVAIVLAVAGALILLWGLAYRRLAYALGSDSLDVAWFGRSVVVPYASIEGIYTGQRLIGNTVPKVPAWPGIYVGSGHARGLGRLRFFTTSPDPAALTLISSQRDTLVVSARDPHAFRAALIERVERASDAEATHGSIAPGASVPWSAVRDRWLAASLALSLTLLLAMQVALAIGFGALPETIPLRFDASGQPTHVAPAEDLLRLPLLATVLVALNAALGIWLHLRERLLARLLWIGGVLVQAIVFVAIVRLLQ